MVGVGAPDDPLCGHKKFIFGTAGLLHPASPSARRMSQAPFGAMKSLQHFHPIKGMEVRSKMDPILLRPHRREPYSFHRSEGDLGHSSVLARQESQTDKKGAPLNQITACPFRSKPFSLFIVLSKRCIAPIFIPGAFGPTKICRRSKRTAKKYEDVYAKRYNLLIGAKMGSIFAPRLYPSPPKCGRRFGKPKTGIAALVISMLRRVLWTFFGLCDLQIFRRIVRSHPDRRTGAKTGSVFAPGFHSAGDGMKASIVISPLRRGFWTFFGLSSARGENGQKKAPL